MKEQKHIDRLFQERFKEFDVAPPPEVWDNIQTALRKEEKEDRKLIPIWWKVAGVAALLALFFSVGTDIFSSDPSNDVVVEDTSTPNTDQDATNKDALENLDTPTPKDNIVNSNQQETVDNQNAIKRQIQLDSSNNTEAIAAQDANTNGTTGQDAKNSATSGFDNPVTNQGVNTQDAIARANQDVQNNTDASSNNKTSGERNNALINTQGIDSQVNNTTVQDAVATENANSANNSTNNSDPVNTENSDSTANKTTEDTAQDGKISLLEYIKEQEEAEAVAELEATPDLDNRWSIAPQVAPVFYGSLAEGSSVGSEFSDNTKSADANVSYGVQVQYNVNDRFALRTGVSKVNLSYNTNDIEFAVAPSTLSVSGTKFNTGDVTYAVGDKGTLNDRFSAAAPTDGLGSVNADSFQGLLNQQLEYWEVPVEASYALINNRFKLNVVGGFSTLLLQDNTLKAISGAREANLGALDNLNDLSFTTNVGLGFQYSISTRFAVNVEPMFKYQLNPYSDSSVNFRPFYMGIYSGLSFKF